MKLFPLECIYVQLLALLFYLVHLTHIDNLLKNFLFPLQLLYSFFCRGNQLEILSCLSVDLESPELAKESRHCLKNFLKTIPAQLSTSLVEKTQENVFESCQGLSRLGRGKSASQGLLYESQELGGELTRLHGQLMLLREMEAAR